MSETLYLCGVGNGEGIRLAQRVALAQERWQRIVLLDDDAARHDTQRLGLTVAGGFERLAQADPARDEVVNLVTRTTAGRAKARERIASFGIPFASLVHPGVDLLGTELDVEVTVYANSCIGAESRVACSSVVLTGAVVGHGARVGPGCVIAPNAVINARVVLGEQVYVGSNATILPDIRIGAGATIAANTLVVADVPEGATALGVPAALVQRPATESQAVVGALPVAARAAVPTIERARLEAEIAAVMREVLSGVDVTRGGNFFDLGGTSLKAVQLCQLLNQRLGLAAQALDLFRYSSVAALAQHFYSARPAAAALEQAHQRAALRRAPLRR